MAIQSKIEITESNLRNVLGEDYSQFRKKILTNVYCMNCQSKYTSTITDYRIFINELNDTILEGFCKRCRQPVNRYLETGENPKYEEKIFKLKKILKS